jgi:aerobic carbon-monoxide dehydrogenase medium subunit
MSVPVAFDYCAAKSIDEAIALMQQYGDDAKFLAGGQSLLPTMKLRLAQPEHLIDLGRIQGLSYIREEEGAIAVNFGIPWLMATSGAYCLFVWNTIGKP